MTNEAPSGWRVPHNQYQFFACAAIERMADKIDLPIANRQDTLGKPGGSLVVAKAIYEQLCRRDIAYSLEAPESDERYQFVRHPEQVLTLREGTCLDLALLYAGIARGKGLVPLLVVLKGHALVAISTRYFDDQATDRVRRRAEGEWLVEGVLRDGTTLDRLLRETSYFLVECTGFASSDQLAPDMPEGAGREAGRQSFERAVQAGSLQLDVKERPYRCALDIATLRKSGLDDQWLTQYQGPVLAAADQATDSATDSSAAAALTRRRVERMPSSDHFLGRETERELLARLAADPKCRCVVVTGAAGMGKSLLTAQYIAGVLSEWEYVLWLEMKDAPRQWRVLEELSQWLSDGKARVSAEADPSELSARVVELFSQRRVLLAMDNLESLLNVTEGTWLPEYAHLGGLIEQLAGVRGSGLLLLTSQRAPAMLRTGYRLPARHLPLTAGLQVDPATGRGPARSLMEAIVGDALTGSPDSWRLVIRHYNGNPYALEIVARGVVREFGGSLDELVRQFRVQNLSFDRKNFDVFLQRQVERVTNQDPASEAVLYWLATARDPVTPDALAKRWQGHSVPSVTEKLAGLVAIGLAMERRGNGPPTTLSSQAMAFVTRRLVLAVADELRTGALQLLRSHGLLWTDAREFVRSSQRRLVLCAVLEEAFGDRSGVARLTELLGTLDRMQPHGDYAAGNLLNLLIEERRRDGTETVVLDGCNLAGLYLQDVDFEKVVLRDVDLTDATLRGCMLPEEMGTILAGACPSEGVFAAGDSLGLIHLWDVKSLRRTARLVVRNGGWVWSLAGSPCGRFLVSGHEDGKLRRWEIRSKGGGSQPPTGEFTEFKARRGLGHARGPVRSTAFLPDGRHLVSGGNDGRLLLWRLDDATLVREIVSPHTGPIWAMATGQDSAGKAFVVTGGDDCVVQIHYPSEDRHEALCVHDLRVQAVAVSHDGRLVASAGQDGIVRLTPLGAPSEMARLVDHQGWIWSLDFSPDHRLLASGGEDLKVRVWNLESRSVKRCLVGHTHAVRAVRFASRDRLVSGGYDQMVKVWSVHGESNTAACIRTWRGQTNQLRSLAFSPDGAKLASGGSDGALRIHELAQGSGEPSPGHGHSSFIWGVRFSEDGRSVATVGDDATVRIWQTSAGQAPAVEHTFRVPTRVRAVAFQHSSRVAAGSCEDDSQVRLYSPPAGYREWQFEKSIGHHINWIWSVAFHPNDRWVATGSEDESVALWDIESGEQLSEVKLQCCRVHSVAFSPSGTTLATGGSDRRLRFWEVSDQGKLGLKLEWDAHDDWIWAVAFSPDGRFVASAGADRSLRLWPSDAPGQRPPLVDRRSNAHQNWIRTVTFDRSSERLASAGDDGTINVWSIDKQRLSLWRALKMASPWKDTCIARVKGLTKGELQSLVQFGGANEAKGVRVLTGTEYAQ